MGARQGLVAIVWTAPMLAAVACGSGDDKGLSFSGGVAEPITDASLSMTPETSFIRLEGSVEAAPDASGGGGLTDARAPALDATKLPGDDCPATPPSMGSSCTQMISCTYDACDSAGTTTAQCDGQHWALTTKPCAPFPCPADTARKMCNPGEICMVIREGAVTAWSCNMSACGSGPINCRCAAYGGFETCAGPCVGTDGHQVNCQ